MTVIECKNLTKSYGAHKALNNVSLTIQENKIVGLVGRNGAGKTTLLKIIAGFWRKTSGDLRVFTQQPFNQLLISANTIFIDDQMSFPNNLTLMEILRECKRFYKHWDEQLAIRLFKYFSFRENAMHNQLSKGKKSTFNMIVGLASHCPLTIFDEPTTGMDAVVRKDFYRALLKDYLNFPRTIILSSHHLEEIEELLEEIILIDEGQLLLHESIDAIREYALGLTGNTAIVEQYMNEEDVIFKEQVGIDETFAVIRNNFQKEKLERLGMTVANIPPSDICVYLTKENKGGIDDVFRR